MEAHVNEEKNLCAIRAEMHKIAKGIDEVPDYGPCQNFTCKHNLFNLQIQRWLLHSGFKYKETEKSREILNCGCLIVDPWKLEDIESVYGLNGHGQGALYIVQRAIKKLRNDSSIQHLAELLEK